MPKLGLWDWSWITTTSKFPFLTHQIIVVISFVTSHLMVFSIPLLTWPDRVWPPGATIVVVALFPSVVQIQFLKSRHQSYNLQQRRGSWPSQGGHCRRCSCSRWRGCSCCSCWAGHCTGPDSRCLWSSPDTRGLTQRLGIQSHRDTRLCSDWIHQNLGVVFSIKCSRQINLSWDMIVKLVHFCWTPRLGSISRPRATCVGDSIKYERKLANFSLQMRKIK